MHRLLSFFFMWIFALACAGQTNNSIAIQVAVQHHQKELHLLNEAATSDSKSTSITSCKFYLSAFKFLRDGNLVLEEKNSFHLIDAADIRSQLFQIAIPQDQPYNAIEFFLGIDSLTNSNGIASGALDPLNGMYWAWQSGYINFKLEGRDVRCPSPKHEFQFHLGGYLPGQNALQKLSFPVQAGKDFQIVIDIDKVLEKIDLSTKHHLMSPSKDAVQLSAVIAQAISIKEQ